MPKYRNILVREAKVLAYENRGLFYYTYTYMYIVNKKNNKNTL